MKGVEGGVCAGGVHFDSWNSFLLGDRVLFLLQFGDSLLMTVKHFLVVLELTLVMLNLSLQLVLESLELSLLELVEVLLLAGGLKLAESSSSVTDGATAAARLAGSGSEISEGGRHAHEAERGKD